MDVQSFPLDPARVGLPRIPQRSSSSNPTDLIGPPHARKASSLKANRRDVVSRGVVVETLLYVLSTTGSTFLGFANPVFATDNESNQTSNTEFTPNIPPATELVKGRITLAPNVDIADPNPNAALYITCRPDKVDSVPVALLNAYQGRAPPVLSVRIPNPTFPMDFVLKFPNDITLEGGWDGKSPLSPTTGQPIATPSTVQELWWNRVDLLVSARWDSDGIAATRSPDDLVGRGLWKYNENRQEALVEIPLTGRGAFGKFATSSKK